MKQLLFTAAAAILAIGSTVSCSQKKAEAPEKWNLVWEETFDGESLDTNVWVRIPRGESDWNNYMTTEDTVYSMRDGNLVLHGIRNYEGSADTAAYLTGGVYTKGKKSFGNGRIEICAKLGHCQGSWPAIWMLPDPAYPNSQWPKGGEIDIMERLSADTFAYQTVHSYYTLELKKDNEPPHYSTGTIKPDDYNVYAVEMYDDSLSFFINDTHTFTYPRIKTELEGQFHFPEAPYYLLIDMQLGGNWVGAVDPAGLPVEMLVDWVRFYELNEPEKR
ncbi:glycoside hydrolase family 16 protein [Paramuribaculum intestinale]|uniref:glycoside hydrolase family 16 protein n=1 Tax=Paramuribaculum intestinale TaxID=2094151 RepID=UPI00259D1057|nr:glycoside hydrolase family 16 protein [Paramuribaculum intestinale]